MNRAATCASRLAGPGIRLKCASYLLLADLLTAHTHRTVTHTHASQQKPSPPERSPRTPPLAPAVLTPLNTLFACRAEPTILTLTQRMRPML
jgi:hypothetical protein